MSDDVWMPPEIIYLVRDDEESEVCWCSERINDTDVEYRRVPAPGSRPLSFTARELLRCLLNQAFRDGYLDPDEIEPSTEELMRLVDARPQVGSVQARFFNE